MRVCMCTYIQMYVRTYVHTYVARNAVMFSNYQQITVFTCCHLAFPVEHTYTTSNGNSPVYVYMYISPV